MMMTDSEKLLWLADQAEHPESYVCWDWEKVSPDDLRRIAKVLDDRCLQNATREERCSAMTEDQRLAFKAEDFTAYKPVQTPRVAQVPPASRCQCKSVPLISVFSTGTRCKKCGK